VARPTIARLPNVFLGQSEPGDVGLRNMLNGLSPVTQLGHADL